jgi:TRAP-type mannitol/chloroaromatic compound transport system permease small subunit
MSSYLKVASVFDKIARKAGEYASWIIIPLILVIVMDVVSRKLDFVKSWAADITIAYGFSPSFIMQDLEWHLHGVLLLFTFGFGYLYNSHVRVDIFRENASRRGQVKIETFGLIIGAIPFLLVMMYYSWIMTYSSFTQGEGSESQVGIGYRFIIKGALVIGFALCLSAVIATLLRCIAYLRADADEIPTIEKELQFLTGEDAMATLILQQNEESLEGKP